MGYIYTYFLTDYYIFCQVDPFLFLVEDCKLKTVDYESDHHNIIYGSKEDDNTALQFLSELDLTEFQSKESLTSLLVKSLELSDVNLIFHIKF